MPKIKKYEPTLIQNSTILAHVSAQILPLWPTKLASLSLSLRSSSDVLHFLCAYYKNSISMLGALMFDSEMCNFNTEIMKIEGKPTVFSYNVLKAATRSFNVSSKLGEGGFGVVYKV